MIKAKIHILWELITDTFKEFQEDSALHFAASLSFYAVFSLAPTIYIVISFVGAFWGHAAVSGEIYYQLSEALGDKVAIEIQNMVGKASQLETSFWAKLAGSATLIFASTGVFSAIQDTLNIIWGVKPKPKYGLLKFMKDRLLSFAIILSIALVLLVSLILNAMIVAFAELLKSDVITWYFLQLSNYILSLAVITILLAIMYKVLPDAKIMWKDVWIGALVTGILFTLGKSLLAVYLGHFNPGSGFGTAGTIIVLLLWVFISSILLFLGAEFTQVQAKKFGHAIKPRSYAVKITTRVVEMEEG